MRSKTCFRPVWRRFLRLPKKKSPQVPELICFGSFRLRLGGKLLPLKSGKAKELLALLACEDGGPVSKRWAASLLWEEAGEEQAMDSLSKVCRTLRAFSKQHGDCLPLLFTYGELGLDMSRLRCDLSEFSRLAASDGTESLRRAAALHAGELLAAEAYEWAGEYGGRLEIRFLELCEALADRYREQGKEKLARQYERFFK